MSQLIGCLTVRQPKNSTPRTRRSAGATPSVAFLHARPAPCAQPGVAPTLRLSGHASAYNSSPFKIPEQAQGHNDGQHQPAQQASPNREKRKSCNNSCHAKYGVGERTQRVFKIIYAIRHEHQISQKSGIRCLPAPP